MGRFKDYKLFAAVLVILVTAGPVLWFSAWLQKQGRAEVSSAASWTLGNVDLHVGRAEAVLEALVERGVHDCGEVQLEVLRRSLLTAGPVKELSIVSMHGPTLCTDRGFRFARYQVISSAPTANPMIVIEVVRLGANDERMLACAG